MGFKTHRKTWLLIKEAATGTFEILLQMALYS